MQIPLRSHTAETKSAIKQPQTKFPYQAFRHLGQIFFCFLAETLSFATTDLLHSSVERKDIMLFIFLSNEALPLPQKYYQPFSNKLSQATS